MLVKERSWVSDLIDMAILSGKGQINLSFNHYCLLFFFTTLSGGRKYEKLEH